MKRRGLPSGPRCSISRGQIVPLEIARGMRIGPRHPRLGNLGFRLALPLWERFFAGRHIHRADSAFAREKIAGIRSKIERGERVLLAGVSAVGMHNSGVAL